MAAGGGAHNHRHRLSASAFDVLPTAGTVALAKGCAARACCEAAMDAAWPDLTPARACVEMIPHVALAALIALCPDVTPPRLARCLGLDPATAPAALETLQGLPDWPRATIERVAGMIAGVAG